MSSPSFRNISRNPNFKKYNSNTSLEYKNKSLSSLQNNIMDLVLFINSSLNNSVNISSLNILSKLKSFNNKHNESNNFVDMNNHQLNEEILKKTTFGEGPQEKNSIIRSLPNKDNHILIDNFSKLSNKNSYKTDINILHTKKQI